MTTAIIQPLGGLKVPYRNKEVQKAAQLAYYYRNRERILARQKKKVPPEKKAEYQKAYYEKNKEKVLKKQAETHKRYYAKNREKILEKKAEARILYPERFQAVKKILNVKRLSSETIKRNQIKFLNKW